MPFALKLALYYEVARYVGPQVDSYSRGPGAKPHVIWRNNLVKHKGAIIVPYGHASTKQFFSLRLARITSESGAVLSISNVVARKTLFLSSENSAFPSSKVAL